MKKKVLITRPRDQADEFAAMVLACGAEPIFFPLLEIHKISYDINAFPDVTALVVTSSNAIPDKFPDKWIELPVYCVGGMTASLCRGHGATGDIVAARDIGQLIPLLAAAESPSFLYLRGADISENIGEKLMHKSWYEVICYRADIVKLSSLSISEIIPSVDIITFFSARTAAAFSAIVTGTPLAKGLSRMTALSLSDKGLNPVRHLEWGQMVVAPTPDIKGMVWGLKELIDRNNQ